MLQGTPVLDVPMVKRVADDMRMTCTAGAKQGPFPAQDMLQTMPTSSMPFSMRTPSDPNTDSRDMDMDTEMLPEDYVLLLESTPIWEIPDDDLEADEAPCANGPKKMRVDSPSEASTTASSPAAPSSPCMVPSPHEPEFYTAMTEEEIRERLGVAGTTIAMEWDREDLLATLMEIEKVIPEMSNWGQSR